MGPPSRGPHLTYCSDLSVRGRAGQDRQGQGPDLLGPDLLGLDPQGPAPLVLDPQGPDRPGRVSGERFSSSEHLLCCRLF